MSHKPDKGGGASSPTAASGGSSAPKAPLSPTSAKRMLVMYQLDQQAQRYLADASTHETSKQLRRARPCFVCGIGSVL